MSKQTGPQAFAPNYPASFPTVTTVGGTDFPETAAEAEAEADEHKEKETTWAMGGGGFSNRFPRPSYQEDAVTNFLKQNAADLCVQNTDHLPMIPPLKARAAAAAAAAGHAYVIRTPVLSVRASSLWRAHVCV
jgi:hypothetical protein